MVVSFLVTLGTRPKHRLLEQLQDQSSHAWGVVWPEPGGKEIISAEGHPNPLTDALLKKKNRQGKKKSLPKDLQHQFCCKIQSHVCDL